MVNFRLDIQANQTYEQSLQDISNGAYVTSWARSAGPARLLYLADAVVSAATFVFASLATVLGAVLGTFTWGRESELFNSSRHLLVHSFNRTISDLTGVVVPTLGYHLHRVNLVKEAALFLAYQIWPSRLYYMPSTGFGLGWSV